jgi:ABC-type transporter Mla subunit MlaD
MAQLARATATAYTPATRLDDPRIAKLRELLDQATKLLDGANELVADLTEQLQKTAKDDDKEPEAAESRGKTRRLT